MLVFFSLVSWELPLANGEIICAGKLFPYRTIVFKGMLSNPSLSHSIVAQLLVIALFHCCLDVGLLICFLILLCFSWLNCLGFFCYSRQVTQAFIMLMVQLTTHHIATYSSGEFGGPCTWVGSRLKMFYTVSPAKQPLKMPICSCTNESFAWLWTACCFSSSVSVPGIELTSTRLWGWHFLWH